MGTGDYICVTLRGGAPWGFSLTEGEGDTYRPLLISQVEEGGRAFLAGVQEGDEVVSFNGEPCAELTLLRAFALIDTSIDCLQLLLKRQCSNPPDVNDSVEKYCGQRDSSGEALKSTTLHIFSPKHRSQSPRELNICKSQNDAYNGEFPKGPQLLCTKLHALSSGEKKGKESVFTENDEVVRRCFSPGDMVECQVSLSEQTLDDMACTSLGSARGIEGAHSNRETIETTHTHTTSHNVPCSVRQPLSQHGVVLSSPSMLGQVEVILQKPAASEGGRGILTVGGPRVSGSSGFQSKGEEEGEHCEGVPGSFTVTFGIPSEEGTPVEDQDSDSEEEQGKPNKHRPRHARLRRSESLSEKQVKEAKSKCKHIALLLTAAPPKTSNKGLLMFKKHRQRAKKYTLVSYGTGEEEPEYSEEEDEEEKDNTHTNHTVEFTLVAPNDSDINKHFLTDAHSSKGILTINWDKGLLEIEGNLNNQAEMECLPETKGKGALMFAQRRQRMDEIAAEHEELRRQGIPVEGVQEAEKKTVEHSYMQSATEGHAYMDVNTQQSQHQQQYQQYQEQQYYEQQQNYQQQQQYQQQQYDQQQYQQQQMYQQQQEYQQQQQHVQHYSANINGTVQHQASSFSNRTAKPFSVGNMVATPYSPAVSGTNQDSVGQVEQIASRDERISTPAIRSGLLMDTRRRNTGKPMFTFKEAPKVSPNPALLNLLNRNAKKLGFESGAEEDYLSLGAEACNFLQPSRVKHKTPPPVAPKPMINPNSPPWSAQFEATNQDMPQHAENSVSTPAVAPTAETIPAPELEPTPAPAPELSSPPAPQEAPANNTAEKQQHTWTLPETESQQQPLQVTFREENGHINSTLKPEPMTTWTAAQAQAQQPSTNSWHAAQAQPREPPPSPSQTQAQPQAPTNTWTPQIEPSWSQSQEQTQAQTHAQPSWAQSQEQPQVQTSWTHCHEESSWGQPQELQQPHQAPWIQPSQTVTQHQPQWVHQSQQKSQPQPSWVQHAQPESQSQPPWVQQSQHQASQQAWTQAQTLGQSQSLWPSAQTQQQQHEPSVDAWPPSQAPAQTQPQWGHAVQTQPRVQSQANLNPWPPVPPQAQSQPSWPQHPPEHGQHTMNSWAQEQNQAQQQPPWTQPVPPQSTPQQSWQASTSKTLPQPPVNTWPPAQTQPKTPVHSWSPQSQQTPVSVSTSMVNTRPSPKPWHLSQKAPQNQPPPAPPQRMHSFTFGRRALSPINPMATILNPSSPGSAFEMPVLRGKGADMFAKRQSRMEKFVVDSETVQANKSCRSTSPSASLPSEWKYTSNVRAPPPRAYNPIQSPLYPLAATKQLSQSSPLAKAKKKGKDKHTPAHKPLNVVDVMKHQPYQLSSSLFTYGPAAEAPKASSPKPDSSPPNPPLENQPIRYEQITPVQPTGPLNAPYTYGIPMQPVHDGHYQQTPDDVYPPPSPYQQPPGGLYQQTYNQEYQQSAPPAYHPQSAQLPNPSYQQAPHAPYQPASSPPYLASPSVPYQPQPPSSYAAPSFNLATRPESASGGNPVAAPKPRFTANKSSAQALGRSYSLFPSARVPSTGQKFASASSSPNPPTQVSPTPPAGQTTLLEKGQKPLTPWEVASRHPLGLVDEAFTSQSLQQTLASNIHLAAQRKLLPEPPAEWKARVSSQAPKKTGSQTWSQSRSWSRATLPTFVSPTKSTVSASVSAGLAGYRSLPRQWQPQTSVTQDNLGPSVSPIEHRMPLGKQTYKSVYTSSTWSWRR